eukprot:CAMPEP_0172591144 /NCGR_PEP_ID=MMETSP1068-20121228/9780_1 /TAXON_ID=35684 /ORGANISM="Pseudopedinella elastica, Strain CCMP716" /LENGTH=645 /DNA_ID=CAMNT_0013387375 /DNA_START=423 /DNA_END=2360 /DNA_ORIENTATION=+
MANWRRALAGLAFALFLDDRRSTVSAFSQHARLGFENAVSSRPRTFDVQSLGATTPEREAPASRGEDEDWDSTLLRDEEFDASEFEDVGLADEDDEEEDDGAWWAMMDDDDDDDDEAGEEQAGSAGALQATAAPGQSRANPKASDKGSSKLPSRVKRPPVPVVAVLGRPNVGKSALSNRISGKYNRGAIVNDEEGVTRDRTYLRSEFCGKVFDVVDTGGLVFEDDEKALFLDQIRQQAQLALTEAAACILVVDGQQGLHPLDEQVANFLRKEWCSKIPVFVAVNKCESEVRGDLQAADFYKLGLGEPLAVSGIHGTGVAELLEAVDPHLYEVSEEDLAEEEALGARTVSIALIGRPNVGKSSVFNRLFGEARAIVSPLAGTTRDTLDAELERGGRIYKFIDTAGIRRRGKVQYGNEFFMVNRALKAIRRSDVAVLVLDAILGVSDQDRVLAQRISDDGRACVVLLNKWDAVDEKDDKTYLKSVEYVKEALPAVKWAPVLLVSALTGQRCPKIYDAIDQAVTSHRTRVSTAVLNEVIRDAILWQPPPVRRGTKGQGKVYYANQVGVSPPTVALFCNKPGLFSENYKRYLERRVRESLGFEGTPVKFLWRGKRVRTIDQEKRKGASSRKGANTAAKGRYKGDSTSQG